LETVHSRVTGPSRIEAEFSISAGVDFPDPGGPAIAVISV